MDTALEHKLIECLSALERGDSLDQILSDYPEDAARLRPMLETAARLPALRMEPSQAAEVASRRALLAQADALRRASQRRRGFLAGFAPQPGRGRLLPRALITFASLTLAFVLIGAGVVAASGSALPGDPLYGVKRAVENVRLSLAPDTASRDALTAQFYRERIDETTALLTAGQEAEVEFSAIIESIQPDTWVVTGLAVQVDGATHIDGVPLVSRRAQVRGRTVDGVLIATSISVEPSGEPAPSATPELEATPTPQLQVAPSHTSAPGLTLLPPLLPTLTTVPGPALTPLPLPTLTPEQLPTRTPEPGLTLVPLLSVTLAPAPGITLTLLP